MSETAAVNTSEGGLNTMILGISVLNWLRIVGNLLILYVFLGLYFTMLLVIGMEVRGTNYIRLPSKYFGDFVRNTQSQSLIEGGDSYKQSIPKGCDKTSDGLSMDCDRQDTTLWNQYPWVIDTQALGTQDASCFADTDITHKFLSIDTDNMLDTQFCGNFLEMSSSSLFAMTQSS